MTALDRIRHIVEQRTEAEQRQLSELLQLVSPPAESTEKITCVICQDEYDTDKGVVASFCWPQNGALTAHLSHLLCHSDCKQLFATARHHFDDSVHDIRWNCTFARCPQCRLGEGCGDELGENMHGATIFTDAYVWVDGKVKTPLSSWSLRNMNAAGEEANTTSDEPFLDLTDLPSVEEHQVPRVAESIVQSTAEIETHADDAAADTTASLPQQQQEPPVTSVPDAPEEFTSTLSTILSQELPRAYTRQLYEDGDGDLETALSVHFGANNGKVPRLFL